MKDTFFVILIVVVLFVIAQFGSNISGHATEEVSCDWTWWPGNGQKVVIDGVKYQCPVYAQYCKADIKKCCKHTMSRGHYSCVNPPGYTGASLICSPGEKRCNKEAHKIEICELDGLGWEKYEFCPFGCSTGSIVCNPDDGLSDPWLDPDEYQDGDSEGLPVDVPFDEPQGDPYPDYEEEESEGVDIEEIPGEEQESSQGEEFQDVVSCVWDWPQRVKYYGTEYSCGHIGGVYRPWCNNNNKQVPECCQDHSPYRNCVRVA